MNDNNSLAHTKWNCKYHIVFAPKYRRKLFYGENRKEIGGILRQLSEWKGVKIVEAEVCPDHIHMLVEIPPKMSVAGYIGFLKGRSSLMIFQRHGNLKYKYGNRSFWCRGYYVDTAGKNTKKIAQYIQNQLKEDQLTDQMTLKEYMDPLAGNKQQSYASVRPLCALRRCLYHRALPASEIPPLSPGDIYSLCGRYFSSVRPRI